MWILSESIDESRAVSRLQVRVEQILGLMQRWAIQYENITHKSSPSGVRYPSCWRCHWCVKERMEILRRDPGSDLSSSSLRTNSFRPPLPNVQTTTERLTFVSTRLLSCTIRVLLGDFSFRKLQVAACVMLHFWMTMCVRTVLSPTPDFYYWARIWFSVRTPQNRLPISVVLPSLIAALSAWTTNPYGTCMISCNLEIRLNWEKSKINRMRYYWKGKRALQLTVPKATQKFTRNWREWLRQLGLYWRLV